MPDNAKARAERKAAHELIPSYLRDTFADLDYWERKLKFYQQQRDTTPTDKPWYGTIERKIIEIEEIIAMFNTDAIQLNRKLRNR